MTPKQAKIFLLNTAITYLKVSGKVYDAPDPTDGLCYFLNVAEEDLGRLFHLEEGLFSHAREQLQDLIDERLGHHMWLHTWLRDEGHISPSEFKLMDKAKREVSSKDLPEYARLTCKLLRTRIIWAKSMLKEVKRS